MKKVSFLNTWIGAIPGALPFLVGWFSVRDDLTLLSSLVFIIYYWWQLPHFFAISWINKVSYKKAGFKMVSLNDSGNRTAFHMLVSSVVFLLSLILPFYFNFFGYFYFIPVTFLSFFLFKYVILFYREQSNVFAKKILFISILYPPLILIFIVVDFLVR